MKIVLQRVHSANVSVDNAVIGEIGRGLVVFLGIAKGDTQEQVDRITDKISRLRIFADSEGKTNLSSGDVGGEILIISQFTLLADITSNRPSFSSGAEKELAISLYEHFISQCKLKFCRVQTGKFGAHMVVNSVNDGPFTLSLDA